MDTCPPVPLTAVDGLIDKNRILRKNVRHHERRSSRRGSVTYMEELYSYVKVLLFINHDK